MISKTSISKSLCFSLAENKECLYVFTDSRKQLSPGTSPFQSPHGTIPYCTTAAEDQHQQLTRSDCTNVIVLKLSHLPAAELRYLYCTFLSLQSKGKHVEM